MALKRTVIYLDPASRQEVERRRALTGASMSEVIRRMLLPRRKVPWKLRQPGEKR